MFGENMRYLSDIPFQANLRDDVLLHYRGTAPSAPAPAMNRSALFGSFVLEILKEMLEPVMENVQQV